MMITGNLQDLNQHLVRLDFMYAGSARPANCLSLMYSTKPVDFRIPTADRSCYYKNLRNAKTQKYNRYSSVGHIRHKTTYLKEFMQVVYFKTVFLLFLMPFKMLLDSVLLSKRILPNLKNRSYQHIIGLQSRWHAAVTSLLIRHSHFTARQVEVSRPGFHLLSSSVNWCISPDCCAFGYWLSLYCTLLQNLIFTILLTVILHARVFFSSVSILSSWCYVIVPVARRVCVLYLDQLWFLCFRSRSRKRWRGSHMR